VSIVARRYGIQPNQLFTWRKLATQGALTATAAEEDVVPASEYRALQNQVKELQRLTSPAGGMRSLRAVLDLDGLHLGCFTSTNLKPI
jgi:transposase-like protein